MEQANDHLFWNKLVEESPDGTLFHRSDFLTSCLVPHALFFIKKGSEIKGGFSLVFSASHTSVVEDDLVIHQGLWLMPKREDQKISSFNQERFELVDFFVDRISREFGNINLALSPGINDIRPFQWFNYHSPNEIDKYRIGIKYTTYVTLGKQPLYDEKSDLFQNLSVLRQRQIREAIRKKAQVNRGGELESLLHFYKNLLERQGEVVEEHKQTAMVSMMKHLIEQRRGDFWTGLNEKSEVAYMVFMGWDKKRAYYLFGAGDDDARHRYCGTYTFWKAFSDLQSHEIPEVDLEGINSPNRGKFKLTFGGNLQTYYTLSLGK